MISRSKARKRGVEKLMSLEDYNNCFFYAFGVYGATVLDVKTRPLYCYGLRRICGYTFGQISAVFGRKNDNLTSELIREAVKSLCIYDPWYDEEFVANWSYLRKTCEPFRRKLTNAEECRRYREKKKRDAEHRRRGKDKQPRE